MAVTTNPPSPAGPPLGGFREIGGRRLFLLEEGSGGPRIVFLPGAGLTGLDLLELHRAAAATRSSLLYDRAGTGFSEAAPLPRTAAAVTDELRSLIEATGDGPVVLVGHSLGGLYARVLATRSPDLVTGLVLLDPAHEDLDAALPPELAQQPNRFLQLADRVADVALATGPTRRVLGALPPVRRYQRLYRELFTHELAAWPAEVRAALVERHTSLDWLAVGLREARRLDRLYAEVRSFGPLPDLPVVVLASTGNDQFRDAVAGDQRPDLVAAEVAARIGLYRRLVSPLARGEVRELDGGHVTLAFRHRKAVLDAIAAVSS